MSPETDIRQEQGLRPGLWDFCVCESHNKSHKRILTTLKTS